METEVTNQEILQETAPETVTEQIQEAPAQEERYQSRNFRELREQRELAERRAQEAEQRARLYEAQLLQQQHQAQQPQSSYQDDDFVDYKTLKNELQDVRRELQESRSTFGRQTAEARLKTDFRDIEQVVTKENYRILEEREPHIAAAIASGTDVYQAGAAAYRAIVGLGIANNRQSATPRNYDAERALADANSKRPRPLGTAPISSDSPLAQNNPFAPNMSAAQREEKYKQLRSILDRR